MKDGQVSLRAALIGLILIALGFAVFRQTVLVPYLRRQAQKRASAEFHHALHATGGGARGFHVYLGPEVDDQWLEAHVAPIWGLWTGEEKMVHEKLFGVFFFERSKVTKDGLAFLPTYTIWLDFSKTRFGDDGIDALRRFQNLKHLKVGQTDVTPAGLRQLAHVTPHLQTLNIDGMRFGDGDVDDLAALQSVEYISLRETALTVSGVRRLAQVLPRLRSLDVDGTAVDDPAIALDFRELRRLRIDRVAPTGSIANLDRHPTLEYLWLTYPREDYSKPGPGVSALRAVRPDIEVQE